ncbi:hypothetical protein [Mycolicibacterium fortuitum]|uniref:hypothetical protein n=1 Tax=Mycolicibacterium fortuitum TaxID=1766 RepID=UPI001041E4B7|nr:hypothetical protein [Mycolicibacterium fortuitum]
MRTSKGAFLCVLCDNNLLFSSGALRWLADGGLQMLPTAPDAPSGNDAQADAYRLALALASLFAAPADTPTTLIVATLSQWLTERADYHETLAAVQKWADVAVEVINHYLGVWPEPVGRFGLPGEAEQAELGTVDPVRSLWARLDPEGRRLMAAALLLLITLDPNPDTLRPRLPAPVAQIYDRLAGVLRDQPWTNEWAQSIRRPW